MIARVWRGWATDSTADDYQRHYASAVVEHLRAVPGFIDARLLRRTEGDEVLFTSVVTFRDLDAVRAFAGEHPEVAVVEGAARSALLRWDQHVTHHEVAVHVP
jgi:heme-degrading monooxygenase HmoA